MKGQGRVVLEDGEIERADTASARTRGPIELSDAVSRYGLLAAWILLIVVFSFARPDIFLSYANFANIFGSQATLVTLTIGMIIPMTVGEFDISMAGLLSACLMLIGVLNVYHAWPIAAVVMTVFVLALAVGLINAFIVVRIGVNSLVATLGMGTLLMGAAYGISGVSIIGLSSTLMTIARTKLFGVQLAFYYGLLLTLALWYVQRFTPLGRNMYFTGANREVARLSGVQVDRLRAGSLIASSLIAALAAIILAGVLGSADPNAGGGYLLPPFAAAFLGATAITPGRFNPWGSFIAVYFLVTGIVGLQILGFSGWIEQVFYGGALVLAVVLSRIAAEKLKTVRFNRRRESFGDQYSLKQEDKVAITERRPARAMRSNTKLLFLAVASVASFANTMLGFPQTSISLAQEAKEIVSAAEQPKTKTPELSAIDGGAKLKGKSIFYLSAGLSFPFSQEVLKGVQDASAVLGMTVVTADVMAGGSAGASSYIDRAVSQGSAAIVLQGVDAYTVKASLADAKAAHIPVVTVAALPPGPLSKELADMGVSASVNFSVAEVGKVMAAYVAANAAPDAHVVLIDCSTFRTDQIVAREFTNELHRLCPKCVLTEKDSPLMQWQTTLPSLARTLVTVDPALTFVVPSVDSMVPSIKPAIIAVGAGDKIKIVSNNAQLPDLQAIATKRDQEVADIGASNERMGWATVDQIARLLSGHPPATDAQPLRLFTTNNIDQVDLKQPAFTWYGPFDFKSHYRKLWGF
jgi:ribose/xylose/arabinose/galactoside ABC-type transport system permease subunit/ABC-type sugar transport system substrate-binding protein